MRSIYSLLFIISLFVVALACKSDDSDPLPAPTAEFTMDKRFAELNELVSFTNNSANAVSYNWAFGDGTSSTQKDPSKSYNVLGKHIVELTATTEDNQMDSFSDTVTVGNRTLQIIFVGRINWLNPETSNPWDDDGTGPDLVIGFTRSALFPSFETLALVAENASQDDIANLTVGVQFDEDGLTLRDENYIIALFEYDEDKPEEEQLELMSLNELNPIDASAFDPDSGDPGKNPETGEGFFVSGASSENDSTLNYFLFNIR
ncbi:PKD domain-containing protein [Rapidithrix thailandica]|uniref:PKD domain-containing protein n=1 Tax=Rapidithrix thailandica TaxID=413964 RepID=A0AAW9S9R5_9BACT